MAYPPPSAFEQAREDYLRYRGKCKKYAEAAAQDDPTLTVVKGWYICPVWGSQEHWWCKKLDGTIVDPTRMQFPSKGAGSYREFDGHYTCEYCGNRVHEDVVYNVDHHIYCSYECYGRDVL